VAWLAERKNLVSVCFGLLSLLAYASSRRRALAGTGSGAAPLYVLSLALFALALTGKAAAMTLSAVIVATDRLLEGRWRRGAALRAFPFFALAALAATLVSMREAHITVSIEPVPLELRPLIAVAALVHYVATVFFPFDQAIIYPRWEESFAVPRYWGALLLAAGAAFLAWKNRSKLGDHWFWGVALFGVTVSPVLGLKHFAWMQFAFVSDHYLYLGSAGILLAAVLSVDKWRRAREEQAGASRSSHRGRTTVALGILVLAVGVLFSWRTMVQGRTWQNNVTLWEHTLSVSPNADVAFLNLGNHYFRRKDYATAFGYYSKWADVSPHFVRAKVSSAKCLKRLGRHGEAIAYYEAAIATAAGRPGTQLSVRREFARYLIELRRFEAARHQLEIFRRTQTRPEAREEIERMLALLDKQIEKDRLGKGKTLERSD
jgi:tetratricopeptide (TPR) repeat protein